MSQAKFELFNGQAGQFYFRLKAGNGEIIGASEGYVSRQGAESGIQSVRTNAPYDVRYSIFTGSDNRYYFHLKASNGEIILRSQGYASHSGAVTGKESVKNNAPTAPVVDLTTSSTKVY